MRICPRAGVIAESGACQPAQFLRRDGRAVEGARLESVCRETYRGFESHSLRHILKRVDGQVYAPPGELASVRVRQNGSSESETPSVFRVPTDSPSDVARQTNERLHKESR
jgi:hypothetical protein